MDERSELLQARSMLILLLAACIQTQTALGAAANALDADMSADLDAMILRSQRELEALTTKIDSLPA